MLNPSFTREMTSRVHLRLYDNSWYNPGGSLLKRIAWMFLGQPLFASKWLPSSAWRVKLLRAFGASVGTGVVVKPAVRVKYPWHLELGDDVWIGEESWIDNLTTVRISSNACVSQGAYLCTGNHDWSDPLFGLRVESIQLGEGAWAGAKCILMPGTTLGPYAVVAAGAVVKGLVPENEVYAGNPAERVRMRTIRELDLQLTEVVR